MKNAKNEELVEDVVVDLLKTASTSLPNDVLEALKKAEREETSEVARTQLRTILTNVERAERLGLPMCQDTGLPVFFITGRCVPRLEEAIRRGVSRATSEIPLRPNAVQPLTRSNPGDNLGRGMPYIHFEQTDADYTEITVTPKGAGSENMSAIAMLTPSQGIKGVKRFVIDTVVRAGSQPCPPTIVGVGVGGTADEALLTARRSLLRRLDVPNPDPDLAKLEKELEGALNELEIGPMGLGGRATVLGVHVDTCYTHTASLPVAVCFQCWAARRASARIYKDGRVEFNREGFQ